jgi:hypothetical protein
MARIQWLISLECRIPVLTILIMHAIKVVVAIVAKMHVTPVRMLL